MRNPAPPEQGVHRLAGRPTKRWKGSLLHPQFWAGSPQTPPYPPKPWFASEAVPGDCRCHRRQLSIEGYAELLLHPSEGTRTLRPAQTAARSSWLVELAMLVRRIASRSGPSSFVLWGSLGSPRSLAVEHMINSVRQSYVVASCVERCRSSLFVPVERCSLGTPLASSMRAATNSYLSVHLLGPRPASWTDAGRRRDPAEGICTPAPGTGRTKIEPGSKTTPSPQPALSGRRSQIESERERSWYKLNQRAIPWKKMAETGPMVVRWRLVRGDIPRCASEARGTNEEGLGPYRAPHLSRRAPLLFCYRQRAAARSHPPSFVIDEATK